MAIVLDLDGGILCPLVHVYWYPHKSVKMNAELSYAVCPNSIIAKAIPQVYVLLTAQFLLKGDSCPGSTLNMAEPGSEHLLINCKHIFEQDKRPSYVSVLVLLLSLRYYFSLWNPIGS